MSIVIVNFVFELLALIGAAIYLYLQWRMHSDILQITIRLRTIVDQHEQRLMRLEAYRPDTAQPEAPRAHP